MKRSVAGAVAVVLFASLFKVPEILGIEANSYFFAVFVPFISLIIVMECMEKRRTVVTATLVLYLALLAGLLIVPRMTAIPEWVFVSITYFPVFVLYIYIGIKKNNKYSTTKL